MFGCLAQPLVSEKSPIFFRSARDSNPGPLGCEPSVLLLHHEVCIVCLLVSYVLSLSHVFLCLPYVFPPRISLSRMFSGSAVCLSVCRLSFRVCRLCSGLYRLSFCLCRSVLAYLSLRPSARPSWHACIRVLSLAVITLTAK